MRVEASIYDVFSEAVYYCSNRRALQLAKESAAKHKPTTRGTLVLVGKASVARPYCLFFL